MHNFYVAMGPAGILAATFSLVAFLCSYFLNHFYVLLIIHFFLLPTNTFALPPWSGIPGGGWGVRVTLSRKREEKCEKEAAADPEFGRGGHMPKVPTPLCPWTCSLRTGRVKASPVGRTLLGGHTQSALTPGYPQQWMEKRKHGEWNNSTTTIKCLIDLHRLHLRPTGQKKYKTEHFGNCFQICMWCVWYF